MKNKYNHSFFIFKNHTAAAHKVQRKQINHYTPCYTPEKYQ
jgi:hypothetical protein